MTEKFLPKTVYEANEQQPPYGCTTYYPNDEGLYVPAGTKIQVAFRLTSGRLTCQFCGEAGSRDYLDITSVMWSEKHFATATCDHGGGIVSISAPCVDLLSYGPTAVAGWFRARVVAFGGCALSLKIATEPPVQLGDVIGPALPTVEWRDGEDKPVAEATPPHLITDQYSYVKATVVERRCAACRHVRVHVSDLPCRCCDNTDDVYHTEWQPKDEDTPGPVPPAISPVPAALRPCAGCGRPLDPARDRIDHWGKCSDCGFREARAHHDLRWLCRNHVHDRDDRTGERHLGALRDWLDPCLGRQAWTAPPRRKP